jgi:hypothetical protein
MTLHFLCSVSRVLHLGIGLYWGPTLDLQHSLDRCNSPALLLACWTLGSHLQVLHLLGTTNWRMGGAIAGSFTFFDQGANAS